MMRERDGAQSCQVNEVPMLIGDDHENAGLEAGWWQPVATTTMR
jgi:hypothetical protein